MKLTLNGIEDREGWMRAGVALPDYDVQAVRESARRNPTWVHFGIGNIFRIFIGSIADRLMEEGKLGSGIICAETFDFDVVRKIYNPYDNLELSVILNNDGSQDKRVLAPFAEAVLASPGFEKDWERLSEVFAAPSLQMVSFTITEKGYSLTRADGGFSKAAQADFENGPDRSLLAMGIVTSMLYRRFRAGRYPLALVSMDNCSHNGERLKEAVLTVAREWIRRGYCEKEFEDYLCDEKKVAFPWTMIDKITPRPEPEVALRLTSLGIEDMDIVQTERKTFIAPFGNAEKAQYLVIEDSFPNGRPPLEDAGVYMTDRETVNKSERMKVCTCLNPIHTALCTYDCMLGYELFADGIKDPELSRLAHRIGYTEGLPVVADPGILSPKAFLDEVIHVRMPNPYLGDTSQRIAVDISQMVGIRFGETIKSYVKRYGSAERLTGIPLAIAGWLRYLLAVDDEGEPFELAPDPMIPELQAALGVGQEDGIRLGGGESPESIRKRLRPILSNANIFGISLYEAGIGVKIEKMFAGEIAGKGAVRKTLKEYLA